MAKFFIVGLFACLSIAVSANGGVTAFSGLQFDDVARNSDGSIRRMTQAEAINFCTSQGKKLPTARQWLEFATEMGAKGISETYIEGYAPHKVINADGKVDKFYYYIEGYIEPSGENFKYSCWSSSVESYTSWPVWFNPHGFIYAGNRGSGELPVRCVTPR